MSNITHLNQHGNARMVNVGKKDVTHREAKAAANVNMEKETLAMLLEGDTPKGDVIASARIAGIMAAKKTAELIPLCHPIPVTALAVDFDHCFDPPQIQITASAETDARTGVEMEVMTAVSVAALTIYDMLKSVDRAMQISDVRLIYKAGGKSGKYWAD